MALRNVHKEDITGIDLPQEAISEDKGLSLCGTPQLVLADLSDAQYYKNDRTGIAFKFDSMTVELEDSDGNLTAAAGTAVTFPHQSDAVGYCIDWRQVTSGGELAQGCYRVKIGWTKAGNSGEFYYGSYNLRQYSAFNARGTVRLFVVLNDLVRKQGINYKDSGFANTLRFKGQFGYMQPNYDTENIVYSDFTARKVRNEAVRSYELRSNYLLSCMTRLIDEEHLLAANQIYISDHNANNHVDYYDFPAILSEDESPTFTYTQSKYATVKAVFNEKVQNSESKYDGNIQGSENVILSLPTVVNSCADATLTLNGSAFTTAPSGGTTDITLQDQDSNPITPDSVVDETITVTTGGSTTNFNPYKTGQTVSYASYDDGAREDGQGSSFTDLGEKNAFGVNQDRFTDELGGSTYTKNIYIDHSKNDVTNERILGFYFTGSDLGTSNFATACSNAQSHTVTGFTSGWFLPNIYMLCSLQNIGVNPKLNYSPFNLAGSTTTWSSTTGQRNTLAAYIMATSQSYLATEFTSTSSRSVYFYARWFTYAELGL